MAFSFTPIKGMRWLAKKYVNRQMKKRSVSFEGDHAAWLQVLKTWAYGPDVAESKSVVFGCIRFLVNTISSLPLSLLMKLSGGGSAPALNHPLYNVLHVKPNDKMTTPEWHQWVVRSLLTSGNAINFKVFKNGIIEQLIPLIGSIQIKVQKDRGNPLQSKLIYEFTPQGGGQMVRLEEWEVLHYRYMSNDGIWGRSPIRVAADMIENEAMHLTFDTKHFENGAYPSIIMSLQVPDNQKGTMKGLDDDPTRKKWEEAFRQNMSGLDNAHKLALIPYDFKTEKLSISPADSQALEGQAFASNRVAGVVFGLPGSLFNLSEPKFDNFESQMRNITKTVVLPFLVLMEKRNDASLLPPNQQGTYFSKYNLDSLLRASPKEQAEIEEIRVKSGIWLRNEVRDNHDMPPIDGGSIASKQMQDEPLSWLEDMEEIGYQPRTVVTTSKSSNQVGGGSVQQLPEGKRLQPDEVKARFKPLFLSVMDKIVNRESLAINKKIESLLLKDKPEEFEEWRCKFHDDLKGIIRDNMEPLTQLYGRTLADLEFEIVDDEKISLKVRSVIEKFAEIYIRESAEEMAGKSATTLKTIIELWRKHRAEICVEQMLKK